jgi:hypothetical protein
MRNQLALTAAVTFLTASFQALAAEPPAKPAAEPAKPAAAAAEKPAPAAPMGPPKVATENDVVKKGVGNWKCEGTAKMPDGQEMKYKSSWNVKSALGGHWYTITYKRAKMGPMPAFEGNAFVGYSTADKKYWFFGVDNMAGGINLTSTDGATYTGEGTDAQKKVPAKFVFSPGKDKKGEDSDKLFEVSFEFSGMASSHESCKK